jgi:hypothetical protein
MFYGTFAAFACGVYFLITNVIAYENHLIEMILPIVVFVAGLIFSIFAAFKKLPDVDRIMILLDRVNSGGGMLLSARELADSGWSNSFSLNALPVVKLNSPKKMTLFAAAFIFVVAAYLAPPAVKIVTAQTRMDIKSETQGLNEQLQLLEEEKVISNKEAFNLREQIEKLEKNAAGEDPVKTWEALDHMKDRLSTKAEEFAEKAARKAEALTLSQKALKALQEARERTASADYNQAMKEMAELMRKVAQKCPELSEKLSEELKNSLAQGQLTKEDLEKLLNSQQLTKEQLERLIKKLKECGLSKCNSGSSCKQGGKNVMVTRENFEELMKMLDEESKGKSECENSMSCLMMVCTGGINRGRGDAPMTWDNKELDKNDVKFKALTLPVDAVNNLNKSKLLGVSYGEAKVQPDAKISTGHLSGVEVKGTETNRYILMPKHRAVIKKYFDKN